MRSTLAFCFLIMTLAMLMTPGFGTAQELYPVKLNLMDNNGGVLSGATVTIVGYGTVTSGTSGTVQMQLKAGEYDVSVYYLSMQVLVGSITVLAAAEFPLKCAVFSVQMTLTGLPSNVTLLGIARIAGNTVTARSNGTGVLRFPQLPKGTASVLAFMHDRGTTRLVAEGDVEVNGNVVLSLAPSFDYRIMNVRVFDASGSPVEGAVVRVDESLENATDVAGRTVLYAKDGSHHITVDFYGNKVLSDQNLQVSRDDSWNFNTTVTRLTLTLFDEGSNPVRGSSVLLQVGNHNFTLTTSSTGIVELSQAPYGLTNGVPMAVAVIGNVPSSFAFKGSPVTVHVFTHGLKLKLEATRAYMLGPLTIRVEVYLGDVIVKNATVQLKSGGTVVDKGTTDRGYALLSMLLGLGSQVTVTVEASALGMSAAQDLTVGTSSFVPITMPLAFIPVIMFEVLRRRVRDQLRRVPPARTRKKRRPSAEQREKPPSPLRPLLRKSI